MADKRALRILNAAVLTIAVCIGALEAQVTTPSGNDPSWIPSLSEQGQGLAVRSLSAHTRFVTFAASPDRGILLPVSPVARAEIRARSFLEHYGRAFGIEDPSQVRILRTSGPDELGIEHVLMQQLHMGVPIRAAELRIHLKGSRVMAANGHAAADLPASVIPSFPAELAKVLASVVIAKSNPQSALSASYTEPALEILDRSFLTDTGSEPSRLAWFIEASGPELWQYIWIDAQVPRVLLSFSQLTDAKSRTVYTSANTSTLPGTLIRSEGGAATGDADADNAYLYAGVTYDYYFNNHGRDSFDGAGAQLKSSVHYCAQNVCPADYENAFWNRTQMVYGNGYASADDVVGHELTHAVTQYTAGLLYYNQSGALNESFSDIFGETIDLSSTTGGGNDTTGARWLLGEDLPKGALRSMMNPNQYSNPAKMSDSAYFVCSTSAWTDTNADQGGVHTNSGVPNHAYALMVDGGTYNGKTITGIGTTKAGKIEYRALTVYLTSGSGFLDDYNALNQSCTELVGAAGITSSDCTQVKNALEAVEMNLAWGCAGSTQTPALCPSGTPSFTSNEGFEAGFGNWTASAATGSGAWSRINDFARSGTMSVYGNDPDSTSDHRLSMTNAVTVPSGGRLYFDHAFEFENDAGGAYDAGVIEYSTNGGSTWSDANGLVDAGQAYNGSVYGGNPLGARTAFVRASYGFTGTRLNLATLAGQSLKFRFRIGADSSVASLGWIVDNVAIYRCVTSAPFTDDPLVAGTTPIKAIHITELRTRINAVRVARGLGTFTFTDVTLTTGVTSVKAVHITEMRSALAAAYTAAGMTQPVYTDATLTAGMPVKAIHMSQLRTAVIGIE